VVALVKNSFLNLAEKQFITPPKTGTKAGAMGPDFDAPDSLHLNVFNRRFAFGIVNGFLQNMFYFLGSILGQNQYREY
jgi:hypothetical protein